MAVKAESRINVYPESKEITLHPYQTAIFQSKARYLALIAGVSGGKTFLGPIWLLEEIRKHPQGEYMVVAPTYKLLWRKSLPALIEYFDKLGVEYNHKEQKAEIKLSTGATIFLGSADNPMSLESAQCHAIWVDEAGQLKQWAWIVLQARIGFHLGRMLFTTTPYSQNWLYKDVLKPYENGDKDYFVVQFESRENPDFKQEEWDRAKRTLDSDTFDMRYRGLFKKRTGLVYKELKEDQIIEPFDIPLDWTLVGGIDWGFNHPFVFTLFAKNPAGICYNCGEYYANGSQLSEHALEIIKMIGNRYISIYPDPEDPQLGIELKETLYRLGFFNFTLKNVKREGRNWVNDGIRYIKSLIVQDKYFIFNTCKHNIEEKGLYSWENSKAGGDYMDKVRKEDDDVQDAERYALYTSRQTSLQFY